MNGGARAREKVTLEDEIDWLRKIREAAFLGVQFATATQATKMLMPHIADYGLDPLKHEIGA